LSIHRHIRRWRFGQRCEAATATAINLLPFERDIVLFRFGSVEPQNFASPLTKTTPLSNGK
jgi:hypothetical protein